MIVEVATLIIVGLLILFIFKFLKKVIFLLLNSIIGLLALFGFNVLFNANVAINVWSVVIVAFGGTIGFVVVLLFHYLGLAF